MATKNNNDMTLERTLWETAESMRAKGNRLFAFEGVGVVGGVGRGVAG